LTRFHFERPDGIQGNPQTSLIHLNEFVPPQGYGGGGVSPPAEASKIIALFPPMADESFQFYKFYQIKKSQVPTTQTNIPLVIEDTLGPGVLLQNDGFDIRVFDSVGDSIPYDRIESVKATGKIIVWIDMAVAKDSEFVQLAFGKELATDGSTPNLVYDSNYKMVLHLEDDFTDSTSNGNDAINNGSTDIEGKIGRARDFNGSTHFLEVADDPSLNITDKLTLSAWIKSSDDNGWIMCKDDVSSNRPYSIRRIVQVTDPILRFGIDTGDNVFLDGSRALSDVNFDYVVATYDGSEMKTYVNGELGNVLSESGTIVTEAVNLFIGRRGDTDPSIRFDGIIDEPRVSDIDRSSDWIKTEFNNQNDNDSFWFKTPLLITAENIFLTLFPDLADTSYQSYKFYQINKGQVLTSQANIPLVIEDTLGPGVLLQNDGFDIRVFDSVGDSIPYDRIESVKATGKIIVWVDMDLVKDLEFVQLTFGKSGDTDDSTPSAVYDINFKNVYHLNGNGIDSTSNNQDLTVFGTTTVPAKIGNGLQFDGVITDYLRRNPVTGFPSNEITAEFLAKTSDVGDGIISYAILPLSSNEFLLDFQDDIGIWISGLIKITSVGFNDNVFHYVVAQWRSSDGRVLIYIDGVLKHSSIGHQTGFSIDAGGSLVLGQDENDAGNFTKSYNGILQEVILSDINRSAEYVDIRFKNMFENDTFWFKTPLLTKDEDNVLVAGTGV